MRKQTSFYQTNMLHFSGQGLKNLIAYNHSEKTANTH